MTLQSIQAFRLGNNIWGPASKGHLQGAWGCDGECFWTEKRLPRGLLQKQHLLVTGAFGSTEDQQGRWPTQRWAKDWQVSPGVAGKMCRICFTQCIPSAMVNDKILQIPLVLLLSAYQFYLFLLHKFAHIVLGEGCIYNTGKPMAGKTLLHGFSVDAHKGYNFVGGKGFFSVVCDSAQRDKAQKQNHLWDSWDFINHRFSRRTVCPVKHFRTGHIPIEHSRSHPRTFPL